MSDPIIQLKNVNFWYDKGKPNEYHALKDVSVEIERGEYVAFFGASGSGKTTLLYLLAGIEQGQDGQILINGRDISSLSKRELAVYRQVGVGMVFQQFNLIPSLTVAQNVMLPMSFLGSSQDRAKKEAMVLLERLGIQALADRFPTELSGGQQQRVAIARALGNNPPIIVADEPLGNLDSSNAQGALALLKDLNEKDGRTIIMVTHEAWSLRDAQRIFLIKDGVVTEEAKVPGRSKEETLSKYMYGQLAPELNKNQLAARSLSELLLRGYSAPELKRFEFFLGQRLEGKIDAETFEAMLDRSWKEGGLGLWRRKAMKMSEWIEGLIEEKHTIEDMYRELEANPASALKDEVDKLKAWLLQGYEGKISDLQDAQLTEIVYERIRGIITPELFLKTLNLPRRESGLGFAMHTAQRIGEKLELAMKQGHPDAPASPAAA